MNTEERLTIHAEALELLFASWEEPNRHRVRRAAGEGAGVRKLHRRIPEAVDELNELLRGWSGYIDYRQSTRVFGKTQDWVRDRLHRWLWRKHNRTKALWSDYPQELLHDRGL